MKWYYPEATAVAIQMFIFIMLEKACVEIAFLIRIKEGVRQPRLEFEACAMSAADAICAKRGDELILALSVAQFNTDFCGSSSSWCKGFDSVCKPKNSSCELN